MANKQLQLPPGFRHLETQVAGHTFEPTNSASIGLLQNSEPGNVLKPLGKPECGERELSFYTSLMDANADSVLAEARRFVPKFYQQLNLIVNGREHMFIKLEDLTYGMQKPCVMDVKIGKRTWDPLASPHKRAIEEQKYFRCKQTLGLCLPGFQMYVPPSKSIGKTNQTILVRHGRDYGKSLDSFGFRQTIATFLNVNTNILPCCCAATTSLIREVLEQLYIIRDWFKHQRIYYFYASSLLITYDFVQFQKAKAKIKEHLNGVSYNIMNNAQNSHEDVTHDNDDDSSVTPNVCQPASQWVKVRMIDFAHVFPADNDQLDKNYLFGLENLISIIESIIYG